MAGEGRLSEVRVKPRDLSRIGSVDRGRKEARPEEIAVFGRRLPGGGL